MADMMFKDILTNVSDSSANHTMENSELLQLTWKIPARDDSTRYRFHCRYAKRDKTLDQLHENSAWNKHEVFLLGIIWALSVSESEREGKQTS